MGFLRLYHVTIVTYMPTHAVTDRQTDRQTDIHTYIQLVCMYVRLHFFITDAFKLPAGIVKWSVSQIIPTVGVAMVLFDQIFHKVILSIPVLIQGYTTTLNGYVPVSSHIT